MASKTVREYSFSREELLSLIRYVPETGEFFWRERGRPCARGFNRAMAGKPAGCLRPGGNGRQYLGIIVKGEMVRAHRVAWYIHYGYWPSKLIDHRDRDGLNNAISNLREADYSSNGLNRNPNYNSVTGVTGVSIMPGAKLNPFRADIKIRGKRYYLGCFPTLEAAKAALDEKRAELLDDNNHPK